MFSEDVQIESSWLIEIVPLSDLFAVWPDWRLVF